MTARERIIELAKKIQDDKRYGQINAGSKQYPHYVPVSPFVVLGLLLAIEEMDNG